MFYLFAIGSMLGYALQTALLVHYARKIDGLTLAFYRGVGFILTLSPLLLGATHADVAGVLSHWQLLIVAGLAGGLYLTLIFTSYRYLPAGVSNTFGKAGFTVVITAVGWLFLNEALSAAQLACIAVILAGTIVLGFQKHEFVHLDARKAHGILLTLLCSIPQAVTIYGITVLSRTASPLVSGYVWELSIAVGAGILLILRRLIIGTNIDRMTWKTFTTITLCGIPTLVGTGLFCLAAPLGPVAILNAIGSAALVMVMLLSWLLYGERMKRGQWLSISLVLTGVIALRFV